MTVLSVSSTSQYDAVRTESVEAHREKGELRYAHAIWMTSLTSWLCFFSYSFVQSLYSSLSCLSALVVKYMPFVWFLSSM